MAGLEAEVRALGPGAAVFTGLAGALATAFFGVTTFLGAGFAAAFVAAGFLVVVGFIAVALGGFGVAAVLP